MDNIELTEENLVRIKTCLVKGLGNDWKMFVRFLGVEDDEIITVEQDNINNNIEQVYKALNIIFNKFPSTNWNNLKEALKLLEKNELIDKIESFLITPPEDKQNIEEDTSHSRLFSIISKYIVLEWKDISRKLGLSDADINIISSNHSDVKEQAYQALKRIKEIKKILDWSDIKPYIKPEDCQLLEERLKSNGLLSDGAASSITDDVKHSTIFRKQGFGIIAHTSDGNIELVENMFDKFNPLKEFVKNIVIYRGGEEREILTPKEWFDEGRRYFDQFFSKDDYFTFNNENDDPLFDRFKDFIRARKPGFLIQGYNIVENYKFLNLSLKQISSSTYQNIDFERQYIAYEFKNNALYFVQLSQGDTLDEIKNDISACAVFIEMFILLHKNLLLNSAICIVALVVVKDSVKDLIEELSLICKDCQTFVLTKNEFKSFDLKIQQLLSIRIYKTNGSIKRNNRNIRPYDEFKYDIGNILTFMAKEDTDLIPNLTDDVGEQINQFEKRLISKLLFSPQQIALKNSNENHLLIQGSHGSGKSIIGRYRTKQLVNDPNTKCVYYINYCDSSSLTKDMKLFVENLHCDNVKCLSRKELNDRNLSEILQYILRQHKNETSIHLIIEELPIDEMSKAETLEVIEYLKNPKFKEANVIFICQSMVKERFLKGSGSKLQYSFSGQVESVVRHSSMVIKTLYQTARTTVNIDRLVKSAIKFLENTTNKFSHDVLINEKHNLNHESFGTLGSPESAKIENLSGMDEGNTKPNIDHIENEKITETIVKKPEENFFENSVNLDSSFRIIDSQIEPNKKDDLSYFESQFKYHKSVTLLHNIEGPKPELYLHEYNGNKTDSEIEMFYSFILFLRKIDIAPNENLYVLYFDELQVNGLKMAIKSFSELDSSFQEEQYMFENVLDARGMEYKNVIIYVNLNEYHMRHYLIDAMTRCKSNLFFFVVEKFKTTEKSLFGDMISTWRKENLVEYLQRNDLNWSNEEMVNFEKQAFTLLKMTETNLFSGKLILESLAEINRYMKKDLIKYTTNEDETEDIQGESNDDKVVEDVQTQQFDIKQYRVTKQKNVKISSSDFPIYTMESVPRGRCLIFLSSDYSKSSYDFIQQQLHFHRLKSVFNWLKFDVSMHFDLSIDEVVEILQKEASNPTVENHSCFVAFLLRQELITNRLDNCINIFSPTNCPNLIGKPKLFFFYLEFEVQLITTFEDVFVGVFRHPAFVQKFCHFLETYADEADLNTIFATVSHSLPEFDGRLLPTASSTLMKFLYFYPSESWDDFHKDAVASSIVQMGDQIERSHQVFEKIKQALPPFNNQN